MAKISEAKVKSKSGGYKRLFNNEELGLLLSKCQSACITNGNQLEKLIFKDNIKSFGGLDKFIEEFNNNPNKFSNNVFVATKKSIKKSKYRIIYLDSTGRRREDQPDALIFVTTNKTCSIIELKDGDNFDTKKSAGEFLMLQTANSILGPKIPFKTEFYICSFNNNDKNSIKKGFKSQFDINNIMTGKELCQILNLNYEEIINQRNNDAEDNIDYFIDELLKIDEIKQKIMSKINK